jgi:hypothetical protein
VQIRKSSRHSLRQQTSLQKVERTALNDATDASIKTHSTKLKEEGESQKLELFQMLAVIVASRSRFLGHEKAAAALPWDVANRNTVPLLVTFKASSAQKASASELLGGEALKDGIMVVSGTHLNNHSDPCNPLYGCGTCTFGEQRSSAVLQLQKHGFRLASNKIEFTGRPGKPNFSQNAGGDTVFFLPDAGGALRESVQKIVDGNAGSSAVREFEKSLAACEALIYKALDNDIDVSKEASPSDDTKTAPKSVMGDLNRIFIHDECFNAIPVIFSRKFLSRKSLSFFSRKFRNRRNKI